MLFKIVIVSSTEVGSTIIFENVFLKHHLFQYTVCIRRVAQYIDFSSAKAGLNILDASREPVAPPAPTIV
jgi:hypothetical protein